MDSTEVIISPVQEPTDYSTFISVTISEDYSSFKLSLEGDSQKILRNPLITISGKSVGESHREWLHEKLNECLDKYLETK